MINEIYQKQTEGCVQFLLVQGQEFVITDVIGIDEAVNLLIVKGSFFHGINVKEDEITINLNESNIHTYRFSEDVIDYSYFDLRYKIKINSIFSKE